MEILDFFLQQTNLKLIFHEKQFRKNPDYLENIITARAHAQEVAICHL